MSDDEGAYFSQKVESLEIPMIQINSDVPIMNQLNQMLQEQLGFIYQSEFPPYYKLDLLLNEYGVVRVYLFRISQLIQKYSDRYQIVSFERLSQILTSPDPGLESRIPYVFDFPDYTDDELWDIFQYELDQHGYKLSDIGLKSLFYDFLNNDQYNGREIRTLVEHMIKVQAVRLSNKLKAQADYELTRQDLIEINESDLKSVLDSYRPTRYDRSNSKPKNGQTFNLNLDPRLLQTLFSMANGSTK